MKPSILLASPKIRSQLRKKLIAHALQQFSKLPLKSRDQGYLSLANLILLENNDVPGIVGVLGTILGKNNVNIANMSLSRNDVGGVAMTILQLDSIPSQRALDEVKEADAILNMHLVEF